MRVGVASEADFFIRHAEDITRGGVLLAGAQPQPHDALVRFKVELSDGTAVLRGIGQVRWHRPPPAPGESERSWGLGVKFVELEPASRELVNAVVAVRGPEADSDEPPFPESAPAILAAVSWGEQVGGSPLAAVPELPSIAPVIPPMPEPAKGSAGPGVSEQDLVPGDLPDDPFAEFEPSRAPRRTPRRPAIASAAPAADGPIPLPAPMGPAEDPASGASTGLKAAEARPAARAKTPPRPVAGAESLEPIPLPAPMGPAEAPASGSSTVLKAVEARPAAKAKTPAQRIADTQSFEPIPLPAPMGPAEAPASGSSTVVNAAEVRPAAKAKMPARPAAGTRSPEPIPLAPPVDRPERLASDASIELKAAEARTAAKAKMPAQRTADTQSLEPIPLPAPMGPAEAPASGSSTVVNAAEARPATKTQPSASPRASDPTPKSDAAPQETAERGEPSPKHSASAVQAKTEVKAAPPPAAASSKGPSASSATSGGEALDGRKSHSLPKAFAEALAASSFTRRVEVKSPAAPTVSTTAPASSDPAPRGEPKPDESSPAATPKRSDRPNPSAVGRDRVAGAASPQPDVAPKKGERVEPRAKAAEAASVAKHDEPTSPGTPIATNTQAIRIKGDLENLSAEPAEAQQDGATSTQAGGKAPVEIDIEIPEDKAAAREKVTRKGPETGSGALRSGESPERASVVKGAASLASITPATPPAGASIPAASASVPVSASPTLASVYPPTAPSAAPAIAASPAAPATPNASPPLSSAPTAQPRVAPVAAASVSESLSLSGFDPFDPVALPVDAPPPSVPGPATLPKPEPSPAGRASTTPAAFRPSATAHDPFASSPRQPADEEALLPAEIVADPDPASRPLRAPELAASAAKPLSARVHEPASAMVRNRQPAEPATPTAYDRLGRAFEALRRKDFASAEAELQWAIALEPSHPRLRIELGLLYGEWSLRGQDHDGAAEAAFARAAELDPSSDAALVHLAEVQLRRGLFTQARESYQRAQKANPSSRAAEGGLAAITALRFRRRLLASLPVAASLFVVASAGWFVRPLRRPVTSTPAPISAPQIASATAQGPQMVTLPASSLEALTRALAQANSRPVVAAPAAPPPSAAPARAEPEKAIAEASPSSEHKEIRRHARSAPRQNRGGELASLVKQGDSALRSGRVDDALSAYNKALAMNPKFAPAHRGLGSVYVMQGRDSDAKAAYKEYLALAPKASDAPKIQALLSDM